MFSFSFLSLFTTLRRFIEKILVDYGRKAVGIFAAGSIYLALVLSNLLSEFGTMFWDVVPDYLEGNFEPFQAAFENANYWFPVQELITLFIAYWAFVAVYGIFKVTFQLLMPTLG